MGPYIETEVKNKPQPQPQLQAQTQQPQTPPPPKHQSQPQPPTRQQSQQHPQQQSQPQQSQPPQQQEVEVAIKVVVEYEQPKPQSEPPPNVNVREEKLFMVSNLNEQNLKRFNIIVGSFSVENNARNLAKSLQTNYNALVVVNEKGMFRVIIASFDNYYTAKDTLENSIKSKFPDAWILARN